MEINLIETLNAVAKEYCVLRLSDKHSYKIINTYGKVLGTIVPYLVGEKGAYFEIDESIVDLSIEELKVILQMVDIVDKQEK